RDDGGGEQSCERAFPSPGISLSFGLVGGSSAAAGSNRSFSPSTNGGTLAEPSETPDILRCQKSLANKSQQSSGSRALDPKGLPTVARRAPGPRGSCRPAYASGEAPDAVS